MTPLLIVLAVTCGTGVDILAESQPDGRLTKRECCQEWFNARTSAKSNNDKVRGGVWS